MYNLHDIVCCGVKWFVVDLDCAALCCTGCAIPVIMQSHFILSYYSVNFVLKRDDSSRLLDVITECLVLGRKGCFLKPGSPGPRSRS